MINTFRCKEKNIVLCRAVDYLPPADARVAYLYGRDGFIFP